jgi:hypothetical protein
VECPEKEQPELSPSTPTKDEFNKLAVSGKQDAEVSLMFVKKEVFLVCLLHSIEFSIVVPIENKGSTEVYYHALKTTIVAIQNRGFAVLTIISDSVLAMASTTVLHMLSEHDITSVPSPAGEHMPMVSQRALLIKKEWRSLARTLTYDVSFIIL